VSVACRATSARPCLIEARDGNGVRRRHLRQLHPVRGSGGGGSFGHGGYVRGCGGGSSVIRGGLVRSEEVGRVAGGGVGSLHLGVEAQVTIETKK